MNKPTKNYGIWPCVVVAIITALLVAARYEAYPVENVVEVQSNGLCNVVYCARDIPANKIITRDDLYRKRMPLIKRPANACDCIYVPLGRKLSYPAKKDDWLSPQDFGLEQVMGVEYSEREPPMIRDLKGDKKGGATVTIS